MYKTLHKKQGSVTVQLRFARSSVTFCAPRDTNPMGWLINTAKNKIRELNKSLKKIECEVGLDADEYTFTEDGYGKSELDLVITKGLTEEEKNRFHKYFLHGYSISELAQLEKISENNMSVRISRLRSKIAQNIPDESGIDKKYKKSV